jgi:hypothetical protein
VKLAIKTRFSFDSANCANTDDWLSARDDDKF